MLIIIRKRIQRDRVEHNILDRFNATSKTIQNAEFNLQTVVELLNSLKT
jgi:hypothetical protein